MSDFAKLRTATSVDSLQKAIQENSKKGFQRDERYWRPTVDSQGNGYATIRFIPPPPADGEIGQADCFKKFFRHSFKGPSGQWYIELSLTSLGQKDPASELNSKLWNSGSEQAKEQARKQKRKETYVCNIVVVDDPAHPEYNGKAFLFNFGKKIMEKIQDKLPKIQQPGEQTFIDPDEVRFNAFNLWEGANFKLKVRQVDKFPNYDKSEFLAVGPLYTDDAKMEAVWKAGHSIAAEVAPDKFKTYGELKARLDQVMGTDGPAEAPAQRTSSPTPASGVSPSTDEVTSATTATESEEDDDFTVFQRMAASSGK